MSIPRRFLKIADTPPSGNRGFWIAFGAFFGIALCFELVLWCRGSDSFNNVVAPAALLSIAILSVSPQRPVRLVAFICAMLLSVVWLLLALGRLLYGR